MTEKQIREQMVKIFKGWMGKAEKDGSHKAIIDLYNSHKPLARGYKVKYTDAWCATCASAVVIKAGLTDIIPTECSCQKFIELAKKKGIWVENDAHKPQIADFILYDWEDNVVGDNKGHSDHIGMVIAVSGDTLTVAEGNINDKVGTRKIKVNAKYIRGYVTPKYASKATKEEAKPETKPATTTKEIKVGDIVTFTGNKHYTSSYASGVERKCKGGKAKVTAISKGKPHPYHLVYTEKGCTVYGWVNTKDIK